MDAQTAARMLGGVARGNRVSAPGPNHSKHDRSMTVIFNPDGFIVHSFANDDWQECKTYVRTVLGISDDWKPDPSRLKPVTDPDERNYEYAMDLWAQSQPAQRTLVEAYLKSRRLSLPDSISCIRFHPSLKYNDQRVPAMVALYRDIRTNEPRGVHRTFLRSDGSKIDRRMLASAKGAAIKLDEDENVTYGLAVGEGIETCLTARQIGHAPVWALMSAQGIHDFPVLSGIDSLTFLGERDPTRTNELACKAAARRWIACGAEAQIYFPRTGKDLNDAI